MINYTIFISSSDKYSDIWPLFFDMFQKFWPEYNGEIVLNTEALDYSHKGLDIRCTKVGYLGAFGKVFHAGLNKIETDNVLLIMIDYIFMEKVNHNKIEEYFECFINDNLDSLCLEYQGYPNTKPTQHDELVYVLPPAPHIMFSYQIAFWKKAVLYEMALPHENPWMSEWFGAQRAEKMKIKLVCPKTTNLNPIFYDLRGCLHQGKWLGNAVSFLKRLDYSIDFEERGYYVDGYNSIYFRVKLKWMIWSTGLKGSYWDLFKR